MAVRRIDHLYAETREWGAGVAFWEGLGFSFTDRWGSEGHRAGRLECGQAGVVLAEIGEGTPEFNVFFDADAIDAVDVPTVVTPPSPTHWGTRWLRLRDPDGRIHVLEDQS